MKLLHLLILNVLGLSVASGQPAVIPESFTQYTASISGQNDTTRIAKLLLFQERKTNGYQFNQAKLALDAALQTAELIQDSNRIARVHKAFGLWANKQNNYPLAFQYYQQALAYTTGVNQANERHQLYVYIGNTYQHTLDINHAVYYYNKVIGAKSPKASLLNLSLAYGGLANLADQRADARQALYYNTKAQSIAKQLGRWDDYYNKLVNIAFNYSDLDRPEESVLLYEQCMQYVEMIRRQHRKDTSFEKHFITAIYDGIPYPLIKLKRYNEAEEYAKMALVYGSQDNGYQTLHRMWVYDALTLLYEKKGDYPRALAAHKQWAVYRDSIQNQTRSQKFAELETRYQTKEKEARIRHLDLINVQKTRQLWAGIGGVTALLSLLSVMVWQYQRIRRSRAKIQQQSDQMALMMKELHHRVKNNLAIVSSLLNLQVNRLHDPIANQAMIASQQRVNAMSLIHQRLYLTDQITRVNIKHYFVDLAQNLLQVYGHSASSFNLTIDVDQQEIEVDIAIPLGLIANEVITNALKYAYTDNHHPLLRIGLYKRQGLVLEVEDNGPGIDQIAWQQVNNRTSFGKQLIRMLSQQLEAQYEFFTQKGTLFRLIIPEK